MKKYYESVIKEIEDRFNEKRLRLYWFETFRSMSGLQDKEVINFCNKFPFLMQKLYLRIWNLLHFS